jgi:hypothetical protein
MSNRLDEAPRGVYICVFDYNLDRWFEPNARVAIINVGQYCRWDPLDLKKFSDASYLRGLSVRQFNGLPSCWFRISALRDRMVNLRHHKLATWPFAVSGLSLALL